MSKDAAKFRKNAKECFARAKAAPDEATRARWLALAQYWLNKARTAEGPPGAAETKAAGAS